MAMKIPVVGSVSLLCASAALAVQIQSNPPPAGTASPTNPTAGPGQANPPVPITNPTGQPILARPCVPTAGTLATGMSSAPMAYTVPVSSVGVPGATTSIPGASTSVPGTTSPGSPAGTISSP